MDFYGLEAQDGVRFTWNNLPGTQLAATRAHLPMGVHYTPYKDLENIAVVQYNPIKCLCGAILNPHVQVDFKSKVWFCNFCNSRLSFPTAYAEHISQKHLPAELQHPYSTIEYLLPTKPTPNVFIYLIDLCLPEDELNAMRDSIQQSLNIIPPETYVGLITFNRFVFVHELGFQECPQSYAFQGNKQYQPQQIQQMLGLSAQNDPRKVANMDTIKRFLLPLAECEFSLNSIMDDLQPDPWIIPPGERPQRATGTALNIAISILEACPFEGPRIVMFTGGPCTVGPGQVVGLKLEDTLRSYNDISKDNDLCKYMKKASKYYQDLSKRAIKSQQVVDIYGFTVDQFGLLEMVSIPKQTGGYIVCNEEFDSVMFQDTYRKLFDKDQVTGQLKLATAGRLEVFLSKELKISGVLGQCSSLGQKGPMVSEVELGESGTTAWYIGGLDRNTTLTFLLDLPNHLEKVNPAQSAFIQWQTIFKTSSGQWHLRVTTVSRRFSDPNVKDELIHGFDQEAACVMMARLGCLRSETEEPIEVLKWMDRTLIRVVKTFSNFKPDSISSFTLPKQFGLYPQFMYHLRRSHFIQTFGASPDEIMFYRATLIRENITNCLVMIQPALLQYRIQDPNPVGVMLDTESMKADVILLLDTYFHVCVWLGDTIKKWKDAGYQDMPEHEGFKALLESPMEDVKLIMEDRLPVPTFYETYPTHTKERYLKSRVNPSNSGELKESGLYVTDDASLQLFMDHLIQLVVTNPN